MVFSAYLTPSEYISAEFAYRTPGYSPVMYVLDKCEQPVDSCLGWGDVSHPLFAEVTRTGWYYLVVDAHAGEGDFVFQIYGIAGSTATARSTCASLGVIRRRFL